MSGLGKILGGISTEVQGLLHSERAGGADSTNSKIEHLVVLALENRSFDHMLGYLRTHNSNIDGPLEEFNYADPVKETGKVYVSADAPYVPDVDPSPSHEFHDVMLQLYKQLQVPGSVPSLTNLGFMYDYAKVSHDVTHAGKIMRCFAPGTLPALHALAQEFAICDHWFSSLPGPTWPNRFFMHCATSGGYVDNASRDYPMRTIFQNLSDKGVNWRIYYHDFPQSLALRHQRQYVWDKYEKFQDAFQRDCSENRLPQYSFIEPRYFNAGADRATDQHPIHGVVPGDNLIADVYEAIRNSDGWPKTLLVVIWDEHGGFYDHVSPPLAIAPGDGNAPEFDFTRLGVRVPAILVSPYIPRGVVDHTDYDHSSVCATLKELFDLPSFLTKRDAAAKLFVKTLTLDEPRAESDTPRMLSRITDQAQIPDADSKEIPPTELHSSLLALAESLSGVPSSFARPAYSEEEAANRAKSALERFRATKPQ